MKDRGVYQILTVLGLVWLLPINRMYLGQKWGWRLVTLNWFYIGAITDLFYIGKHYDEAMTKRGYFGRAR